ncbi:MAG: inositol-3-phosphate synthase [Nanoarchaeota archaeon]
MKEDRRKSKIKIAIVGVGNCASSLVQGVHYYANKKPEDAIGLMHWELGGYKPGDIIVVSAFDIDARKIGRDLSEAIFAEPNCTTVFCKDIPETGTIVRMSPIMDGFPKHMDEYNEKARFVISNEKEPTKKEVIKALKDSEAEILINYLPVGTEKGTRFYAETALETGLGFINCIPVFIASDNSWVEQFEKKGLPLIGDDVKSQMGATIIHRVLTDLFKKRGVKLERTYQLNFGGNTDFLNMLDKTRLINKRTSKTEAIQSVSAERLADENIHVGPSDYVAWQKDNKICYLRIEGKLFGDVPMNLEMRLSVEDSPNSAGVVIDAIRCCKLALDRKIGGVLYSPSAYFMKHPPIQYSDDMAHRRVQDFIDGTIDR